MDIVYLNQKLLTKKGKIPHLSICISLKTANKLKIKLCITFLCIRINPFEKES